MINRALSTAITLLGPGRQKAGATIRATLGTSTFGALSRCGTFVGLSTSISIVSIGAPVCGQEEPLGGHAVNATTLWSYIGQRCLPQMAFRRSRVRSASAPLKNLESIQLVLWTRKPHSGTPLTGCGFLETWLQNRSHRRPVRVLDGGAPRLCTDNAHTASGGLHALRGQVWSPR